MATILGVTLAQVYFRLAGGELMIRIVVAILKKDAGEGFHHKKVQSGLHYVWWDDHDEKRINFYRALLNTGSGYKLTEVKELP